MKIRDEAGFGIVAVSLIVLVVGLISFAGYRVFYSDKTNKSLNTNTQDQNTLKKADNKTQSANKVYKNTEYGFSFEYPTDWVLKEDLSDQGRNAMEGDVVVTSPSGTKVHFGPDQGGKGGDCIDPDTGTNTTKTCSTFTYIKIEKLSSSSSENPVYFYQASLKDSDNKGGKTKYLIDIESRGTEPKLGSNVGAYIYPWDEIFITNKGSVTVYVEGKDDDKNSSSEFFNTHEVLEATPVLKSFKLL